MDYISVNTNPDMFGAGVGRAVSQFGGTLMDMSQLIQANNAKLATEQSKIAANDAYTRAAIAQGQAQSEFYTKSGVNAVNGYKEYSDRLTAIRKEALDSLGTDEAKRMFDDDFQATMISGINGGATHAAKEQQAALITSAEQRLELIQQDSATKFGDDNLFAKNLLTLDKMVADIGSVQGWDDVTVLNKQFEQRSLAWKYRITAMAQADPAAASRLLGEVRDGLAAGDRIEIQNTVTSALYNRGAANVAADVLAGGGGGASGTPGSGSNGYPTPRYTQAIAEGGLPGNVRIAIADSTGLSGMKPRAMQILHGGAQAAAEIGITIVVTAGAGGGHKSHYTGSQWDWKGYHADGSLWTPAERVYIARGAAGAGADRFGLYSFGEGYRGNGSLHVGYSGDRMPDGTVLPPAMWGHAGFTGGAESRNYTDPDERQFLRDFGMGTLGAQRGVPQGNFLDRVLYAEGGGVGVVSPAGALGAMQVMPDTGAQVAAALGIPFDVWRLKHDHDYNMLIGTTYLNMMLETFQGDEVLAAAAYNAGPGRVWEWIRTNGDPRNGTISHQEWIARIPIDETRGYVTKVMTGSSVPRVSGGGGAVAPSGGIAVASQENFASVIARANAMAEATAPGNPVFASQVRSEVTTQWNLNEKAINEQRQENYDVVLGEVIDADSSGNRPTTRGELITSTEMQERWDALTPEQKDAIDSKLAGNVAPKTEVSSAELAEFDRLKGLYFNDKAAYMAEDLANNKLLHGHPALIKELIDLRWSERSEPDKPKDINIASAMRIALPTLKTIGLDPSSTNAQIRRDAHQFQGAFMRVLTAEQERLGRPLKQEEIRDIVQTLIIENTHVTPIDTAWEAIFGASSETKRVYQESNPLEFFPGNEFNAIEEEVAPTLAVPSDIRKQISDAYIKATGNPPSEAMIQQYYLQGLAKRKGVGK
jgi:hypothetical protein